MHELGEHLRSIAVLGSAVQEVREAFDMLQTETEADWADRRGPDGARARMPRRASRPPSRKGVPRDLVAASPPGRRSHRTGGGVGRDGPRRDPSVFPRAGRSPRGAEVGGSSLAATVRGARAERATAALDAFARYLTLEYSPHAERAGSRRRGAVRDQGPDVERHDARPARDLSVGLGRAAPHRARHRPGRRTHPAERGRRRGGRAARNRSGPCDRGRGEPAGVVPGPDGPHDRRDERRALRHPRTGADTSRR